MGGRFRYIRNTGVVQHVLRQQQHRKRNSELLHWPERRCWIELRAVVPVSVMRAPFSSYARGFTLIELSIVLVIIGLIVGGVLVGQDLIRAAQGRKIISEAEQITTAVRTFQLKYNALPGDMANATTYWGDATASGACNDNNRSVPLTAGGPTCNGNGDGHIDSTVSGAGTQEVMFFWQHLFNAGLIQLPTPPQLGEDLSGGAMDNVAIPGQNIPMSNTGLGAWEAIYWNNAVITQLTGSCGWWVSSYWNSCWGQENNLEFVGGLFTWGGGGSASGGISPAMTMNIDTKIDDGQPATGIIRASVNGGCTIGGTSYNVSGTSAPVCSFIDLTNW